MCGVGLTVGEKFFLSHSDYPGLDFFRNFKVMATIKNYSFYYPTAHEIDEMYDKL
jgi:hypothetical protein